MPASRLEAMRRFLTLPNAMILLLIAVGSVLRFRGMGDFSFWEDELYSIGTATQSGPWNGPLMVGRNMEQLQMADSFWSWKLADPHPPLYEMLLVPWIGLWGVSEVAVRGLSAALGVLTMLSVYALPRSVPASARLVYVLLMAFSGPLMIYSQEARGYSLGICLSAWMLAWLLREMERAPACFEQGRVPAALPLLGALLSLTHYYGLLFTLIVALVTVSRVRGLPAFLRASWRWALALLPALVYVGLGWMGILTKLSAPAQGLSLAMAFKRAAIGLARNFYSATPSSSALFWVFMLVVVVGVLIYRRMRAGQHPLRPVAGVLAGVLVLFFLALVLGTRRAEFFSERYMLFMVPGCLLMVALFTQVRGWPRVAAGVLALVLLPSGQVLWQKLNRPQNGGDWRGAAALVAGAYRPGDLIVNPLNDPSMRSHFQHYLRNHIPQAELDRQMWSLTPSDDLAARLRAAGGPPAHVLVYSHLAFPTRIATTLDVLRTQFGCRVSDPQRAQALVVFEASCAP